MSRRCNCGFCLREKKCLLRPVRNMSWATFELLRSYSQITLLKKKFSEGNKCLIAYERVSPIRKNNYIHGILLVVHSYKCMVRSKKVISWFWIHLRLYHTDSWLWFHALCNSAPGLKLHTRMLQRRMPWEDSLLMVFFRRCILLEYFCQLAHFHILSMSKDDNMAY